MFITQQTNLAPKRKLAYPELYIIIYTKTNNNYFCLVKMHLTMCGARILSHPITQTFTTCLHMQHVCKCVGNLFLGFACAVRPVACATGRPWCVHNASNEGHLELLGEAVTGPERSMPYFTPLGWSNSARIDLQHPPTIDYALHKDNRIHGALSAICPTWPSAESPRPGFEYLWQCGAVRAENSANSMETKTICQANSNGWSGWCDIGVSQAFRVGWRMSW